MYTHGMVWLHMDHKHCNNKSLMAMRREDRIHMGIMYSDAPHVIIFDGNVQKHTKNCMGFHSNSLFFSQCNFPIFVCVGVFILWGMVQKT